MARATQERKELQESNENKQPKSESANLNADSCLPFFYTFENIYVIMLRHVLGAQCYFDVDKTTKVLKLTVESKPYLIPSEFEKTRLFQLHPNWDGRFQNSKEIKPEIHCIQLPADTNVEEVNIERFDTPTCLGWLVQFHFKKQLIAADHLKPGKSLWEVLDEKPKPGCGVDEIMAKELEKSSQPPK